MIMPSYKHSVQRGRAFNSHCVEPAMAEHPTLGQTGCLYGCGPSAVAVMTCPLPCVIDRMPCTICYASGVVTTCLACLFAPDYQKLISKVDMRSQHYRWCSDQKPISFLLLASCILHNLPVSTGKHSTHWFLFMYIAACEDQPPVASMLLQTPVVSCHVYVFFTQADKAACALWSCIY